MNEIPGEEDEKREIEPNENESDIVLLEEPDVDAGESTASDKEDTLPSGDGEEEDTLPPAPVDEDEDEFMLHKSTSNLERDQRIQPCKKRIA